MTDIRSGLELGGFPSGGLLGLDVETEGLEVTDALRTVQISTLATTWIFDVTHPVQVAILRAIFRAPGYRFVSHTNIDPRQVARRAVGVDIHHRALDSWTAARLYEPADTNNRELKYLSGRFLDRELILAEEALHAEFVRLQGPKPKKPPKPAATKSSKPEAQARYLEKLRVYNEQQIPDWEQRVAVWESYFGWRDIPIDNPVYRHYSGLDPIYALRLFLLYLTLLEDAGIPSRTILDEMRFYQFCVGMAIRGMRVDQEYAREVALGDHERSYESAREEFEALTGFVSGSPKLADYLTSRGVEIRQETENGNLSLAKRSLADALSRYLAEEDPDPDAVRAMELKEAVAESSNYVTFTRNVLSRIEEDGKVHPNFKGLGAETGRMSATDPPVQTVKGAVTRGMFLPNADDEVLVSIDMSQIEPRIFAARSGDETLIRIFQAGEDIYDTLAEGAFGPGFTKRQRAGIKRTVLATLYVGGVGVIVTQLRQLDDIIMSEEEVSEIRRKLFRMAPSLRSYARKMEREDPVWMDSGRFVPVPPEREWKNINSDIQGTARDVLRDSCFRIQDRGYEHTVINLIHDEGIFSLKRDTMDHDIRVLRECFEVSYLGLPVVTEVEVYEGGRWGHGTRIYKSAEVAA